MNKVKEPTFWLLFVLPIIIGSVAVVWLFKPPNREELQPIPTTNVMANGIIYAPLSPSQSNLYVLLQNTRQLQSSTNVIRLKSISLDNLRDWLHGKTDTLDDYQMEFCNRFGPLIKQLIEEERR